MLATFKLLKKTELQSQSNLLKSLVSLEFFQLLTLFISCRSSKSLDLNFAKIFDHIQLKMNRITKSIFFQLFLSASTTDFFYSSRSKIVLVVLL